MVDVDKNTNSEKFEFLAFQRIQTTFNLPRREGIDDSVLKFLRLHCDRGVLEATQGGGLEEDYCRPVALRYMASHYRNGYDVTVENIKEVIATKLPTDFTTSGYRLILRWLTEGVSSVGTVPAIREEGGPEEVSEPSGDESANGTDDGTDADTTEDETDAETEDANMEDDTNDNTDDCESEADPEDEE
ncbi:hypothetical protein H0H92_008853 [Tricholoma furcatifolium]|nr:hypothetical protein H0H92_008853 [Tricholoma furcatifolium]